MASRKPKYFLPKRSLRGHRCSRRTDWGGLTILAPDDVGNGDASDLGVAEAKKECSIRLVEKKVGDVLFADEADDQPGQDEGEGGDGVTGCGEGAGDTAAQATWGRDSPI